MFSVFFGISYIDQVFLNIYNNCLTSIHIIHLALFMGKVHWSPSCIEYTIFSKSIMGQQQNIGKTESMLVVVILVSHRYLEYNSKPSHTNQFDIYTTYENLL